VSYAYQWERCVSSIEEGYDCTDIDYATASAYTLPSDLAGVQAKVVVLATDAQGEVGIASSEVTDVITSGPRYAVSESIVGNGSVTGFETGPEAAGRTADANLSCPGGCGGRYTYLPGTEVELIATPAPGGAFLGWGGACSGSAPTCSLMLGASDEVTATFSGKAILTPVLPLGYEKEAGEAQPPPSGAPGMGGWEPPPPSAASLAARLLGIHYRRRHLQAEVRCQEARPCRLSLAIFAGASTGQAVIARRSFAVPAQRSAHQPRPRPRRQAHPRQAPPAARHGTAHAQRRRARVRGRAGPLHDDGVGAPSRQVVSENGGGVLREPRGRQSLRQSPPARSSGRRETG
jgi:Divergent InlB B-repeat domain